MDITIHAHWVAGFLFSVTRMGAFVAASPVFNKSIPRLGRLALVMSVGLFLADPVSTELTVVNIIYGAAINLTVGLMIGLLTGFLFHLFAIAGDLIDVQSGLANSALFDPVSGHNSALFTRMFSMTSLTVFFMIGGDRLMIAGMATSVAAIPLDGSITLSSGLGNLIIPMVSKMLVAGIELAAPVMAALFVTDAVLGIANRFAPQMNVFMLGMPVKLLLTLSTVGIVLMLFSPFEQGIMNEIPRVTTEILNGLRP
jgi:flagellar biosynthesis protein FliR